MLTFVCNGEELWALKTVTEKDSVNTGFTIESSIEFWNFIPLVSL